jgi:hypothetical protein
VKDKVKNKDRTRLYEDMLKYCDQIGILKEETPMLYLDKQEYSALRKSGGSRAVRDQRYGECNREQRAIFVNSRTREYQIKKYLTEIGSKRTGIRAHLSYRKPTYRYYLHTLVHELVHYRFESMPHGFKFENRIKVILNGRQFESKSIKSAEDKGFKWIVHGITAMPHKMLEQQTETIKKSAKFLHENKREDILEQLETNTRSIQTCKLLQLRSIYFNKRRKEVISSRLW